MATRAGRCVLLLGVLGAPMVVAGCGASKPTAKPTMQAVATSSSASSPVRATDGAIAAYEGMWADMAKAGETANWRDPALATHASDSALDEMVKLLKADEQMGAVLKGGPPTMHPTVTSAEPAAAPTVVRLSDCLGMQHWLLYRKDTGALWDDKPGTNRATTAEVVLSQGAWKVVGFDVAGLASC